MIYIDFSKYNEEPLLQISSEVIEEFADYSGQSEFDVVDKIIKFKVLANKELQSALEATNGDKWEAHKLFYETNEFYIYDLLSVNGTRIGVANKLNKFIPNIMWRMQERGDTFLDFGGGIGVLCQIMEEWGEKKVTYVDIEAPITNFARWRYKKHDLFDKIEMLIISQNEFDLSQQYSVIFTDAVWEHLPHDKQEKYAKQLANAVEPEGLFVFIVDVDGVRDDRPLHYTVNMSKMFDIFRQCGLKEQFIHNYKGFASLWEKARD